MEAASRVAPKGGVGEVGDHGRRRSISRPESRQVVGSNPTRPTSDLERRE